MDKFDRICKDIKDLKIQGAINVAEAAIEALELKNTKASRKKLISLRPTEPKLQNAIRHSLVFGKKETLEKIQRNKERISKHGQNILKKKNIIFTHCHSSTVLSIIEEGLNKKKGIETYNTETRPLFQGRITSKELAQLKIPNTQIIDSAMRFGIKQSNLVLLGADSILNNGKVINKIGSELVAETSKKLKKPLYICSTYWAFDPNSLHNKETPIEQRSKKEIWKASPKNTRILNPAFEKINPKLIKGIISEYGIQTPKQFTQKVKKETWMKQEL